MADKLVERGLVREPLDLFELKTEQLAKLNLGTDEEPRVFGEKNATKAIRAIERARTLPLSRWLFALAIPDVGRTTATQLARFHETIEDVANSPLLRDVLHYHEKREEKKDAKEIADRLIQSGFAKPSKSKAEKDRGITTEVGPVVAQSVLDFFASAAGKKILRRMKELGHPPQERKSLGKKSGRIAVGRKNFCSYRNIALDDAGRSDRKNRSAWRPRHRQREQENRLRSRRRRARKQIRQGKRTRRAHYRRTRVSQDAVTQLTGPLFERADEGILRIARPMALAARRNRARAGLPVIHCGGAAGAAVARCP